MAPAEGERDRAAPALVGKPAEAAIAVHLQGAAEPGKVGRRPGRLAVAGIDIGHGRRPMSERGTVVGRVAPEPALARAAEAALQGGQRRVVGEHPGMPDHMVEEEIAQRPQPPAGLADPVAQGGAVELDALPGEDLALPVERDAVAVLGHQHLDQQRLSGQATGDDARRRRLLVNALLTAPPGVAGADGHQPPELGGPDVEPFSFVLADAAHLLAAARAATVGKVQHLLDPLEVCRPRLRRRSERGLWSPGGVLSLLAGGGADGAPLRAKASCPGSTRSALWPKRARRRSWMICSSAAMRASAAASEARSCATSSAVSPLLLARSSGTPESSPTCPRRTKRKQHAAASRCRRSPLPLHRPPFQALQQQGSLCGRQRDGSGRRHGPGEMPMLEPSHEQAERDPVMPERLERPTPAAPEEVDRAVERIGAKRLLPQCSKPIHSSPQISNAAGQVNARAGRWPDHGARTADSTRRSAASSTSRPIRPVAPQGKATSISPVPRSLASARTAGAAAGSGSAIAGGATGTAANAGTGLAPSSPLRICRRQV